MRASARAGVADGKRASRRARSTKKSKHVLSASATPDNAPD